jgi:hypothetical protein
MTDECCDLREDGEVVDLVGIADVCGAPRQKRRKRSKRAAPPSDVHALLGDVCNSYVILDEPITADSPKPSVVPKCLSWEAFADMWLLGVPLVLLQLIASIWPQIAGLRTISSVELFAGTESVSNGMRANKLVAIAFEIANHGVLQDFMSDLGFCYCLGLVRRLTVGSCVFMAPVCTSWVWLCRDQSKRCRFEPLGNYSTCRSPWIAEANAMVSRCACTCKCGCACMHVCLAIAGQPGVWHSLVSVWLWE